MKRGGERNKNLGEVIKNKRSNRINNNQYILKEIAQNEDLIETQMSDDFNINLSSKAQLITNNENKYIASDSSPKIFTPLKNVETSCTDVEIFSIPTPAPIVVEDERTTDQFLRDFFEESARAITTDNTTTVASITQPSVTAVHSSSSSTSVSLSSNATTSSSDSDISVSSLSDLSNISLQTAKKQIKKYHYRYLKVEKENKHLKRKMETIKKKNTFMQYSTDEAGDITYENGVKITKLQDIYLKKIPDTEKGDRKFINTMLQIVFGTEELKKSSRTGRSRSGTPSHQLDPGKNEFVERMFWERIKTYKNAKSRFAIYNQCVNRKIQNTKYTAKKLLLLDTSKKSDEALVKKPQTITDIYVPMGTKRKSKKNKHAKKHKKKKDKITKQHDKVNVSDNNLL